MLIEMNKLARDERGATLIEYVLLIGVVALLAVGGFKVFGTSLKAKISQQAAAVETVKGSAD
jgi:Flp pilus assembly pilin Flp